jgi:hypothetical protein
LAWASKLRIAVCAGLVTIAALADGASPGTAAVAQKAAAPAATCANCHQRVTNVYAHAPMRLAMVAEGASPALESLPNLTLRQNGFNYSVVTRNGKSAYTVTDGATSLTFPILWIMGDRSQTFVLEKDGHYYESLVSFYERDKGLATTPGDEGIVPHTLDQAMGRQLSIWEVRNCFTCHASGYKPEEKLEGQKLAPGLNCERCHEGALEHMADAVKHDLTSLPDTLSDLNAGQTSEFCGQCHRTWDKVVREGWHGEATVRFQPYRMANSRCFDAKDKRISCQACHDPHADDAGHEPAFYDSKCLACHSGAIAPAATAAVVAAPKTCPVAKKDCVSCHMPKVALAGGHAIFTDHEIRIVRPGDTYPN